MLQGWFQVAGQCSDIFGVLLLAREWRLSRNQALHESSMLVSELQLTKEETALRAGASGDISPFFNKIAPLAFKRRNSEVEGAKLNRLRNWIFRLGLILIVLGFGLQVIGSVPGGMPPLGIGK